MLFKYECCCTASQRSTFKKSYHRLLLDDAYGRTLLCVWIRETLNRFDYRQLPGCWVYLALWVRVKTSLFCDIAVHLSSPQQPEVKHSTFMMLSGIKYKQEQTVIVLALWYNIVLVLVTLNIIRFTMNHYVLNNKTHTINNWKLRFPTYFSSHQVFFFIIRFLIYNWILLQHFQTQCMSQSARVCLNTESVRGRVHTFVSNSLNLRILTKNDLGRVKVAACHLHTHKQ